MFSHNASVHLSSAAPCGYREHVHFAVAPGTPISCKHHFKRGPFSFEAVIKDTSVLTKYTFRVQGVTNHMGSKYVYSKIELCVSRPTSS